MDKFMKWLSGAVGFMAAMLKGDAAKDLVKLILSIVREVQATGKSGADKRALAFTILVGKLPEIIELAVALMKTEDKCAIDTDGDGIVDCKDPCLDGDCPPVRSTGIVGADGQIAWTADRVI